MQWWRREGLVLVPGHWSERVRMDCDVSPLSRCHPWSHHKLVTDHSEWDVLGEGHPWSPVTGCAYLLWSSLNWHHGYPSSDKLSSLKGVFKHHIEQSSALRWCYAFCLRPIYSVQIFIFSQFAPIEITAWSRVMWTAISEVLCCYWSRRRPGRDHRGDHGGPPNIPSSIGLGQGWEELKRVRKRNKSNINACPALNSSFLNILMGGFSTIQTDLS